MKTMQMTCGTCSGLGIMENWIVDSNSDNNSFGTAHIEKAKCTACDGKGYTEYAMFTLEEAEQIMKVCGLADEVKKHE